MSEGGNTRARRRKRNIRRKVHHVESGDEEEERNDRHEKEAAVTTGGGSGLLSFADEEEAEGKASKLKKKRKQRAQAQGGDGTATAKANASSPRFHFSADGRITESMSSQLCSSGEYTAEKLRRLREANRFNAKTLSEVELKGSFKPIAQQSSEANAAAEEEDKETRDAGGRAALPASTSGRAFGGEERAPSIPSKSEIEAIKENREKWRQIHAASDSNKSRGFIPLSSGGKSSVISKAPESSDDDEDDADKNKARKFGVPLDDSTSLKYSANRSQFVQDGENVPQEQNQMQGWGNNNSTRDLGPRVWSGDIDAQAREAMANMTKALDEMKNREYVGVRELSAVRDKMQSANEKGADAEDRLEALTERYQFLQEMKQYFSDFCECLGEKAPIVEEVEEQLEDAQQEIAKGQLDQRKTLHKLQFSALQAGVLCAMSLGDLPDSTSRVPDHILQKVSEVVSQTEESLKSENKDSINGAALASPSLLLPLKCWDDKFKGRITEDFLTEEDRHLPYYDPSLVEKLDQLRTYSYTVFSDTDEAFCSFDLIKQKLEHFKLRQREAYFQAYVSESLPQLFSPLVRLELLKWDPLDQGQDQDAGRLQLQQPSSIEEMEWYKCLYSYGMSGGETDGGGDADDALVPTLVEKVLLPKVKFFIENQWDVTNLRESKAIRTLVEELLVYLDDGSEDLQELLLIVKNKLHGNLDQANIPMWPQKAARCVPMAQAYTAYAMKRALTMFQGALLWEGLLDHKLLVTLALGEIFQKRLFSYLKTIKGQQDGANALALILLYLCKAVPRSWVRDCKEDLAGLGSFMAECMRDWQESSNVVQVVDQKHLNEIKHFVDALQMS